MALPLMHTCIRCLNSCDWISPKALFTSLIIHLTLLMHFLYLLPMLQKVVIVVLKGNGITRTMVGDSILTNPCSKANAMSVKISSNQADTMDSMPHTFLFQRN